MSLGSENRFRLLQEQYSDPLLTSLSILLLVLLFIVAPLQAAGLFVFQAFAFAVALTMIVGVLVMSGSPVAFVVLLAAFGMNVTAVILRFYQQSSFNLYLVAGAWLMLAVTLGLSVARVVFAPGRVITRSPPLLGFRAA